MPTASLQRDLSSTLNKVGDALTILGRRDEALANYRKSLAIVEALAAGDPQNLQWQADVAFSHIAHCTAADRRRPARGSARRLPPRR